MKTMHCLHVFILLFLMAFPIPSEAEEEVRDVFEPPYYMPQAPEAQALARAIDIPVSYYTGLPNISIPLYEINVGDLKVPITLSYHAGGILANQEATAVGLGWSLSAGGAITRSIKHVDDFLEYPLRSQSLLNQSYFDVTEKWSGLYPDYTYIGYRGYITCDTEPDIYYFSLPNENGKFLFERDTTVIFIKKPCNVLLKPVCAGNSVRFEIIDSKGNFYAFDKKERTHIYSRSGNEYSSCWSENGYDIDQNLIGDTNEEIEDYTSSWLLSRIVTAIGDTVSFEYEPECYQLPLMNTSFRRYLVSTSSQWTEAGGVVLSVSKTLIIGWRLKRISWGGGAVDFHFSDRDDLCRIINHSSNGPKRLSGFTVTNTTGDIVANWIFNHGYFNEDKIGMYAHLFKRLRLESLANTLDSTKYIFDYYEDNNRRLPLKNTKNTDYWGYYNGVPQGKDFFCPAILGNRILRGADKEPRPDYTMLGSLTHITWPTNGTTVFEYEGNEQEEGELRPIRHTQSLHVFDDEYNSEYPTHLSQILNLDYTQTVTLSANIDYDGNDIPFIPSEAQIFTIYKTGTNSLKYALSVPAEYDWTETNSFTSIENLTLPAGSYIISADAVATDLHCRLDVNYYEAEALTACGGLRIKQITGERDIRYSYSGGIMLSEPCYAYYVMDVQEDPLLPQTTYGNRLWIYQPTSSVRPLSTLKDGYTIGYTEVSETFADSTRVEYTFNNNREELLSSNDDYCPFFPTDFNWYNGLLQRKDVYERDGNLLLRETTDYSQQDSSVVIWGYMYRNFVMYPYELQLNWVVPTLTTTEQYFDSLNLVKTTTIETEYNENLLPNRVTTSLGPDRHVTEYRYATDYADAVCVEMKQRNMIGQPVARFLSRNGRIYNGNRIIYGQTGDRILPVHLLSLNTDGNHTSFEQYAFDTIVTYRSYNRYGKPQELTVKGIPSVFIWGYKGLYPIAEIRNATLSQVQSHLPSAKIDALLEKTFIEDYDNDFSIVSGLRGSLEETEVTTCLFNPLIGVTSITDPSGKTSTYEYDTAGRLTEVRLDADHPLQHFDYHYSDTGDSSNWVKTTEYLDATLAQYATSVQYYDLWGRPSLLAIGGANASGSFLYSMDTYDTLGRPWRRWVAVPEDDISPHCMSEEEFTTLSNSEFEDEYAYEETLYDELGNVSVVIDPGAAWHENRKFTTVKHLTNTVDDKVKRYQVQTDGSLAFSSYYPAGTLQCEMTKDPDEHASVSYKDIFGNVVLERYFTDTDTLDTYRVYDELNRLRFVLSPLCQESESNMTNCRYAYEYNGKGLVTSKTLPGCQPVIYEYDDADQVIMMQDGQLRASGKARHFVYDGLGRLIHQYTELGNARTDELINYYDDYAYLDQYPSLPPFVFDDEPEYSLCRQTGMWQLTSNGEEILTTYEYDNRGRLCRISENGLAGRITCSDMTYTYWDALEVQTQRIWEKNGNSLSEILRCTISNDYYPQTKLVHTTVCSLRGTANTESFSDTIKNLAYSDFGDVIENDRGGTAADMTYVYDLLHGWVKEISSTSGFEQRLYREDNTGHELYNGSISAMTWRVPGQNYVRCYDYTYDGMNRLVEGTYSHLPVLNPHPGIINSTGEEMLATGESSPLGLIPVVDGIGDLNGPININAADRYTERIAYDKNSNITSIERYGMNNQRHFGLIDSLAITRNGNQLKTIEDYAEKHLTYTGASDFFDSSTYDTEYYYNANGALESDINRDIDLIQYDALGNTRCIYYFGQNQIEYVYAADGTKLRTIHRPASSTALTDSIDYVGNLIIKNGQLEMYLFDGGYATFDQNGAVNGWHYYIQDYMGNNRMVVNKNGTTEQVTHYYPYGGVIGDISTNENLQTYKFEGKELDRTFGLDNYDIHARQYFAMMPSWDRIDKEAEAYYPISPYAYCGGDPVNNEDYNGKFILQAIGAIVGAGTEYVGQVAGNIIENRRISKEAFTKVDVLDITVAAAEGALTCGGSAVRRTATKLAVKVGSSALRNTFDIDTKEGFKINSGNEIVTNMALDCATDLKTDLKPVSVGEIKSRQVARHEARQRGVKSSEGQHAAWDAQKKKNETIQNIRETLTDGKNGLAGSVLNNAAKKINENPTVIMTEEQKKYYNMSL